MGKGGGDAGVATSPRGSFVARLFSRKRKTSENDEPNSPPSAKVNRMMSFRRSLSLGSSKKKAQGEKRPSFIARSFSFRSKKDEAKAVAAVEVPPTTKVVRSGSFLQAITRVGRRSKEVPDSPDSIMTAPAGLERSDEDTRVVLPPSMVDDRVDDGISLTPKSEDSSMGSTTAEQLALAELTLENARAPHRADSMPDLTEPPPLGALEAAATKLQSAKRGQMARKQLQTSVKERDAAKVVQAAKRGQMARKQLQTSVKERDAAMVVQAAKRGQMARKQRKASEKERDAAMVMQSRARSLSARVMVHERRKEREAAEHATRAHSIAVQTHALTAKIHALTAATMPRPEAPNAAETYATWLRDYDRAVDELKLAVLPEGVLSVSPPRMGPCLQMVTRRQDDYETPSQAEIVGIYKTARLTGMKPPPPDYKPPEEPQPKKVKTTKAAKARTELVDVKIAIDDQPATPKKKKVTKPAVPSTPGTRPPATAVKVPAKRTPVATVTSKPIVRPAVAATSTKGPATGAKKLVKKKVGVETPAKKKA